MKLYEFVDHIGGFTDSKLNVYIWKCVKYY